MNDGHHPLIAIEAMTPDEYKDGGRHLHIRYRFAASPFGEMLVASTGKGICCMEFADDRDAALLALTERFPHAQFSPETDETPCRALAIFSEQPQPLSPITLHVKGTPFQLSVWEALLEIPYGSLSTYGHIASAIGRPRACRAVGTAVGDNPVACLIPCHRVIRSSGELSRYRWGKARKAALIGWETKRLPSQAGQPTAYPHSAK